MEDKTPAVLQEDSAEGAKTAEVPAPNGVDTAPADPTAAPAARMATSPPYPAPCEDGELAAAHLSARDVLVGTVRSDWQMDYCLESLTYYVPARALPPEELMVSVVALYEEGLSRRPGIKRYGEVTETRVVRRADIPVPMSRSNGEEAYYLFSVAEWRYLESPILIEDTGRGRPMLTSRFLLTHCTRSWQLVAITSPAEYRLCELYCRLREVAMSPTPEGQAPRPMFRRVGERHILTAADGEIRLLDAHGQTLFAESVRAHASPAAEQLRRLSRALGLR